MVSEQASIRLEIRNQIAVIRLNDLLIPVPPKYGIFYSIGDVPFQDRHHQYIARTCSALQRPLW
jgi:hypothetical protein